MIDKVELRIPSSIRFSEEFGRVYKDIHADPKNPFRQSQHYLSVGDLRRFGYQSILHMGNVHDKVGNHKLELVETGGKFYGEMADEIRRLFAVEPGSLDLMRVDLAADVKDVPVDWFKRNVHVTFKRWIADIGTLDPIEFSEMGSNGVQTFYLGKRPNVIRVYNKVDERKMQYAKLKARARRELGTVSEFPSFEQMYGHPNTGFTLTRVERQIAGGRVPNQLSTFRMLKKADQFDPFANIVFSGIGKAEPNPDDYDLSDYYMGMYLRQQIERDGIHRVRQFLNRHSKRNANRILKKLADFLPDIDCLIDQKQLFELYRQSVSRQLAA